MGMCNKGLRLSFLVMTLISEPERALPDCEDRGVTIRVYYSLSVAGDVLHCIVSMFSS